MSVRCGNIIFYSFDPCFVTLSYQDMDIDLDPDPNTDTDSPYFLKPRIRIQWGNDKYKKYKNVFIINKKIRVKKQNYLRNTRVEP